MMPPRGRACMGVAAAPGMTLVELLVTLAVSSILLLALMQSLTTAADSWTNQSKNFSAQREARTCLRLLADDLAALVALPGTQFTSTPPPPGTSPLPRMRFLFTASADDYGSARLAFLRTAKGRPRDGATARGDLQLVLYGTALTPDGGASSASRQFLSQKLIRRVFTPEATWRRVRAHLEQNQPLVTDSDWQDLQNAAAAGSDAVNEPLAYDVIRFDAKPLEEIHPALQTTTPWPEDRVPAWLDVTLRVTSRAIAAQLVTAEDWRGQGAFTRLLINDTPLDYEDDRETRTYTQRVRLPDTLL